MGQPFRGVHLRAYILGCSHAAGAELLDGNATSYPARIASALGYHPINLAISGGSNDAMFRIFEDLVDLNEIENTDIVIACWTGSWRTEILYKDTWRKIAVGITDTELSDYNKQWAVYDEGDKKWRLNKIKNIIALNSIAKMQGIHVLNINSFNIIDGFKGFDLYEEYNWPIGRQDFMGWCESKSHHRTRRGHYNNVSHEQFAKLVVSHVKKEAR